MGYVVKVMLIMLAGWVCLCVAVAAYYMTWGTANTFEELCRAMLRVWEKLATMSGWVLATAAGGHFASSLRPSFSSSPPVSPSPSPSPSELMPSYEQPEEGYAGMSVNSLASLLSTPGVITALAWALKRLKP